MARRPLRWPQSPPYAGERPGDRPRTPRPPRSTRWSLLWLVLSLVFCFQVIITMGVGRNRQGERRSRSRLTPQPDGSVVIGGDVLDDRKAQAGAAGGTGAGLVDAEEALEHPLLVLARDADTAVGD